MKPSATLRKISVVLLLAGWAHLAWAQTPGGIVIPSSSVAGPDDTGILAHSNVEQLVPPGGLPTSPQIPGAPGPPFMGFFFETPASIACVYQLLLPQVPGCNPYLAYMNPAGGAKAIGIVDAYHDPAAAADYVRFANQFGLPTGGFTQVGAAHGDINGNCTGAPSTPINDPTAGGGWALEESLDIEWAHAMAPNAQIYLVEAQTSLLTDMYCAVRTAASLVNGAGGGEVSMSWGSGEFPSETFFDSVFTTPGVVYFASAGDAPGTQFPCVSPNVVCVGGTSIGRNHTTGAYLNQETAWQTTGGGQSLYEARPGYQPFTVGSSRGVPDVAADANPFTGVWVIDNYALLVPGSGCTVGPCWFIVGGTSLSAPLWAGITNTAGSFAASSSSELSRLYGDPSADFNDVGIGSCGLSMGYLAGTGFDFCTGRGTPRGYAGK